MNRPIFSFNHQFTKEIYQGHVFHCVTIYPCVEKSLAPLNCGCPRKSYQEKPTCSQKCRNHFQTSHRRRVFTEAQRTAPGGSPPLVWAHSLHCRAPGSLGEANQTVNQKLPQFFKGETIAIQCIFFLKQNLKKSSINGMEPASELRLENHCDLHSCKHLHFFLLTELI